MDSDQAKLFVGGISRETIEETLNDHFSKYGVVSGSAIARERMSRKPRGFGFVWFSESSSADKALQDVHVILGRTVEVKKAIPRREQYRQQHYPNQQQQCPFCRNTTNSDIDTHFRTKKIFVGGLSASLTEEEFKSYFERFGQLMDVVVMHDNFTNRPRGFGFVSFDSEESVDNVMQNTFHELNGRLVEVKRAVPKEEISSTTCDCYQRVGAGKESPYSLSPPGYSLGYSVPPDCVPVPLYNGFGGYLPGAGYYGGTHPMLGYGRFGYGIPHYVPRGPGYGPIWNGGGPYPICYGNASTFPTYVNGGFCFYNGYFDEGMNGKLSQLKGGNGNQVNNGSGYIVSE